MATLDDLQSKIKELSIDETLQVIDIFIDRWTPKRDAHELLIQIIKEVRNNDRKKLG